MKTEIKRIEHATEDFALGMLWVIGGILLLLSSISLGTWMS